MVIGEIRVKQAPRPRPTPRWQAAYEAAGLPAHAGPHDLCPRRARRPSARALSLFAVFDQGDPTTEPYHPAEIRLNSIGGHRWQVLGDWIAWEFEVPEDGLYEIAIKAKQNLNRGTFSNRRILIDGQVPFAELEAVPFNYSSRYQTEALGRSTSAMSHSFFTLPKENTKSAWRRSWATSRTWCSRSEEVLYELNSIYRSIIMITSATPDPMRSYQLETAGAAAARPARPSSRR